MSLGTKRKKWSKEAKWRVISFVRIEDTGYLRASRCFSVPRGILERYFKDTSGPPEELVNVHLGRRTVLPSELENKLVEYCIIMEQRYYELRLQGIKRVAFHLAIKNYLKQQFNQENSEAGKKWLRS